MSRGTQIPEFETFVALKSRTTQQSERGGQRIDAWEADFISSADAEPGLRTAEGGKVNSLPRVFTIGRLLPAVAALVVFCSIRGPTAMAQEHPAHEWGYSGSEGPAHWGELTSEFDACKTGHRQSPVNMLKRCGVLRRRRPVQRIRTDYAPGSFIRVGDKR